MTFPDVRVVADVDPDQVAQTVLQAAAEGAINQQTAAPPAVLAEFQLTVKA